MLGSRSGSGTPGEHSRVFRFAAVGVVNTALDVALLFVLIEAGLNLWLANTLSTGVSLIFSFFVNRSFTFKSSGGTLRQGFWFLIVTLFGLWVLQPLAMTLTIELAEEMVGPPWLLLGAKGIATVVSMTWNYFLYSRLVFRSDGNE